MKQRTVLFSCTVLMPATDMKDIPDIKQKMYTIRRLADVLKKVTTAARKNQMQRPSSRVIRFPKTGS